jgi:hypothetical protein
VKTHTHLPLVWLLASCPLCIAAEPLEPSQHWQLDSANSEAFVVRGNATEAEGVGGKCLRLDGQSLLVMNESAAVTEDDGGFTFAAWVNPYAIGEEQQIIAAKNRYSLNQRQWGVMVDRDGRFRLYLWQDKWVTVDAATQPNPGRWHMIGVVVRPGEAELWINGKRAGKVLLSKNIPKTDAPLTLGGVDDNGHIRQTLFGALDEARLFPRPLTAQELAALYTPVTLTHEIPQRPEPFVLWDETHYLPAAPELPLLENVEFHVIKKWEPDKDGYKWLHGVALAWHKGKLYASFGHNKGEENTGTEEARYRVSEDGGKTWSEVKAIDIGTETSDLAISSGVFCSLGDTLWAFHGAFYGKMGKIHTRAYSLDEATGEWIKHGVVVEDGFWPLNQPVKMDDGNWIMPGGSFGVYSNETINPAAVAISHGDDFTKWDFVRIEPDKEINRMWGESSLFVDGSRVYSIARYGGGARALVAVSEDFGRTWTKTRISNLPMATSKPAAGILSTGQHYLVCTTAADNGGKRTPLTIALSKPGEARFSQVFVIRGSQNPAHAGESADYLGLAYPYAIEHGGKLYVGYSNNGGRRGNYNSAELAIIPLSALAIPEPVKLWDGGAMPNAAAVPLAKGVRVHTIKRGAKGLWMKGVHVAWHKETLYAQFGYNVHFATRGENSAGEQAYLCSSQDGGRTWTDHGPFASAEGDATGVSHGVFLSHDGRLWSFNGAFRGQHMGRVHTRAYVRNEETNQWEPKGVVVDEGFWPLQEPIKLDNGNWIMAGARVGDGNPAAVAISHGNDLTNWDLVIIPKARGKMWGESSVIVEGKRVVNIARYGAKAVALVAESEDFGRTWTPSRPTNLPMATSRPFTGTLSTGQHYLICSTTADGGARRWPLTIAVTRPGEMLFRRILSLNNGEGSFMYPGAAEHDGILYVGYTNGHTPEIAVVPVSSLAGSENNQ